MAHGWNPYLHSFSSLPSDHGTTDPEVSHPAVPPPGDDFRAHSGLSSASISHGASASNTNYFFSNRSGNTISNWGPEIGNAQRNYRPMTWQADGEQKTYLPRWDNTVSNFGTNVLETTGHCTVPPQVGCKQDAVMPKCSPYFENCRNNQCLSDQVREPRSSCEFMTRTSEHNSQSRATPGYHTQWPQQHTNNATVSADRRYSNMWPNRIAENAIKYVQDIDKSVQPDGISFANSHAYTDSEMGQFDNASKPETFVNMCQNPNISQNYKDIDSQTMMDTSETNKTKHLDSTPEAFTENEAAINPNHDIFFTNSCQQENYKVDGPSQSSSQSSVSNDLANSDASLTDASEASNDSQPSFLASALSADNEKVSETADCSPGSQQCRAACDANSDSSMRSESYLSILTETVGEDPAAPSTEVVSAFSSSTSCDPSTLNAGDKGHESGELTESDDAYKTVCCTSTIDNKTNKSEPVNLAANVTEVNQPNVNELFDSAAKVSINHTNMTDSVDLALNATKNIDQKDIEPNLLNSDLPAHVSKTIDDKTNESEPLDFDSPAHVPEIAEEKTDSEPLHSDSPARVTETADDKTNDSEPLDFDSPAHVTEKTESETLDSDSLAQVSEPIEEKTDCEPLHSDSPARVTEIIEEKTNESETLDSDSPDGVTETNEEKTNDSEPLHLGSPAHLTETTDNKTNESEPLDSDSPACVPQTTEEKADCEPLDSRSPAHVIETTEDKTNESEPLDSLANVTHDKDKMDHNIKAVGNEQPCPEELINMSASDHIGSDAASTSTTNMINEKAMVVFDSQPSPMEDSLNNMPEKETASSCTTPNVSHDDQTNDNGIEKAFSNLNTMDKGTQLITTEEKSSPKMTIKQEFTKTTPNTSEIKQIQCAVENLKSEFSEHVHSDEEHMMWDDFGKPLTPSPSEIEESVLSPELKPSTKMSKRLQPIVLVKTTELTHFVSGKYICAQCMHITSSIDDLIEHHNLQHPMRPFQLCKSCGVYLVHQDQSRQHVCGQESVTVSLKSKTQRRPKKFCNKCKIHFSNWNVFISHMRKHTGATPYKCEKCGLYFAQSSTLTRHQRISVRCGSRHRNIQRGSKKFHKHPLKSMVSCYVKLYDISKTHVCKFCGKCFPSPFKLNKHFHNVHKKKLTFSKQSKKTSEKTEVMSEKRKYKCPLCPMTFSHYINRNSHLKACVKENTFGQKNQVKGRFKCPLCLATFTLKSNRYRHLYRFCLRNFLLFLGKDTSKPIKYPRYSKQMETVIRKLKAEEQQLNGKPSENVPYTKSEPTFECNVCQVVFLNKSAKYRHMKKHKVTGHRFKYRHSNDKSITLSPMTDTNDRLKNDADSVKCKYCEKSFASSQALKKHEFTHKGDRPYYCSQCGKGFKTHVVLIQHKITHQRRIQCTVCKKILPTITELIQHRASHTNKGMLQCPDCPRQFTFPVFLLRHLRYHLKTQNKCLQQDSTDSPPQALSTDHSCPFCSQVFDNAKILRKHYLTHIPKSSLQCPFCKRKFTVRRYLLRHIALHVGRKHLSTKNESKKHICRLCSRPFKNIGHLMKHYKSHSKKTLTRCEKCKFYYGISKYSLHKKMCNIEATGLTSPATKQLVVNKAPSAETKLRCQHCCQTFKYPSLFRRHLLTHKNMEVHACILCGQNFPSLVLCSQHEASCDSLYKSKESNKSATHGDESVLKCKFCNKTFTKARNLRRHILTHNEVKPYRCKACESCFSRYDHLKVHLGRCHGKEKLQLKPRICIPKISLDHVGTGWRKEIGLRKTVKTALECRICAMKFATQSKLNWHNSMFHTVKRLKCMQCSTFFAHEKSLQNHIRYRRCKLANIVKGKTLLLQTETTKTRSSNKQNVLLTRILPTSTEQKASKTIKCHFCFRTFRTSAHLKVHMMLHCENSFACDCGKRFFQKAKLQRHIMSCERKRNQNSPRGFSCAYCSSRFLLFSQLQEHFLNSHKLEVKEEPFETAPLQQHLSKIQHSEENIYVSEPSLTSKLALPFEGKKLQVSSELRECPYPCKICHRGFWNKTTLRNHFRKCRRSSSRVKQPKEEDVQLRADINMVLTDSGEENSNDEVEDSEQNKPSQEKKTAVYQCSECDKSFTDGLLLISHLEAHGREEQEKRLNKCSKCGRTFLNQARLEKHMKIHETSQLVCKDCSTVLPSETELEIHRKQCHDPSYPYSCQICHYRFKTKTSLADHCSKNHPNNIFPCHICNRIYTLRASLIRHNKHHHEQELKEGAEKSLSTQSSSESEAAGGNDNDVDNKNEEDNDDDDSDSDSADSDSAPYFPCHVCGKTFTTSESLEDHQRCHLGEKPFECAQCGQCFFQAGQLQQHERKHKSEFQCRVCGRGFLSLFALRKHKHTSGKKRPFRCKKCPLYFTNSALLAEHMLCHREESFPCDICNRVFPSKSSRADHRKIHLPKSTEQPVQSAVKAVQPDNKLASLSLPVRGEFKYRCGVCCLRFKNPEELSEHGCLAGTERQYSCLDCDKHFLHSSHLKKHLLTHKQPSTQKKYPCNQCSKSFPSPQDFLKHLRNHKETVDHNSSQTGFVCPICQLLFTRPTELAFHFPSHQRDDNPPTTQQKDPEVSHCKETKCKKCGQNIQGTDHECSARHIELMNIVSSFAADDDEIDVTGEDHCFCPFCPMQFSSRSNLLEHQNKQHPNEKSYSCKICAKTYAKQKYLDKHVKKHHQPSTTQTTSQIYFKCTQCHTDFNSAKDLSVHLKLHAAEKEVGEYRCDMCYKSFDQLQLLRRHQESHVGQIVYECTECDKAFAFPHLLEEHQKSHV